MNSIKLVYCNINSYSRKKYLINNFIENNDIEATLFVESKTNPESNTTYRNWDIIQADGNIVNRNVRGGSLVQINPRLKMKKCNSPRINNPLNECIHFAVPFKEDVIHIFLIYIHATSRIENSILIMASLFKYAIIIGDFNINEVKKRQIRNFLNTSNFQQRKTKPTFLMANNEDSTPDLLLHTQNIREDIEVELTPDLASDHLAFIVKIAGNTTDMPIFYVEKPNYAKTNTEAINREMTDFIKETEGKINKDNIHNFNRKLTNSITANTPLMKTNPYRHELPSFIIKLIKHKRKLYREYRATLNPMTKTYCNLLNKNIQRLIWQYTNDKWSNSCKLMNETKGKTFFQEIRKMSKYKKTNSIPTIENNGQLYSSDQDKANIFADHFKDAFAFTSDQNYSNNQLNIVNEWYEKFIQEPTEVGPVAAIDVNEYYNILEQQKNTAPGHDKVHWTLIKKLDPLIHQHITEIYNFCVNFSFFPSEWKVGSITLIHKQHSDSSKVGNYRPITLLPCLAKLLEKMIRNRLEKHAENIIPPFQFGFKPKNATIHPLIILTSNTQTARKKKLKTAGIFLDINKAFDSVWHRGLLFKLDLLETPKYMTKLIRHFLEDRELSIRINNATSDKFHNAQGVPQGSPLSPLLYNIFCYDIFVQTKPTEYILQYADDTALIVHHNTLKQTIGALQNLVSNVENWFGKWRLKPNPTKSRLIIFNHKTNAHSPKIQLCGTDISPSNNVKYLGISIDNKINFQEYLRYVKKKTIARAACFAALRYKEERINLKTASFVYKTICRPLLEYAHILFINCRRTALKNISTAETTSLRKITKMRHPANPLHNPPNRSLYEDTKIIPILDRLKDLTRNFLREEENLRILQRLCITRTNQEDHIKFPERTIYELLMDQLAEMR